MFVDWFVAREMFAIPLVDCWVFSSRMYVLLLILLWILIYRILCCVFNNSWMFMSTQFECVGISNFCLLSADIDVWLRSVCSKPKTDILRLLVHINKDKRKSEESKLTPKKLCFTLSNDFPVMQNTCSSRTITMGASNWSKSWTHWVVSISCLAGRTTQRSYSETNFTRAWKMEIASGQWVASVMSLLFPTMIREFAFLSPTDLRGLKVVDS